MTTFSKLALYEASVTDPRSGGFRMLDLSAGAVQQLEHICAGDSGAAAATTATTGTMTVDMSAGVITITPTGNCTFNASGGIVGQTATFCFTTSGTNSYTMTFGTNFRKTGTLATGSTSARFFSVSFICVDGTTWQEISRTAVQT